MTDVRGSYFAPVPLEFPGVSGDSFEWHPLLRFKTLQAPAIPCVVALVIGPAVAKWTGEIDAVTMQRELTHSAKNHEELRWA